MERLYNLKDALMDGLGQFDTVKEGRLKMGELEALNLLTDTVKNVDKICMLEEDGGYSQAGDWEMESRGSYGDGNSYANRGKHYVRGHYSRDDGDNRGGGQGMSRNSYRRGGGYSRGDGKEGMINHLQRMMDDASTDREREAIRRCISQIEAG